MRYAALSDLHLGYRAYTATIEGRNAREVDVERALVRATDIILAQAPDLVTVAGDLFHHPRVTAHAVLALRDFVRSVVTETEARVVLLQGNHDAGRTREVLSPIVIPGDLDRVHVATSPTRIRFRAASTDELVAVACLPFTVMEEERTFRLQPDPQADVNVLVIHAPVNTSAEGVERLPSFYAGRESLDVGRLAETFDVVAAGDFHEFRRLHPTRAAFYSGSLEFVSSDIWRENSRKGVVCGDTRTGEMGLVEVPTRRMAYYDLGDFDHPPSATAETVNDALQQLLSFDSTEGSILRLEADHLPRSEKDAIDWATVRALKEKALHFQLDITYQATETTAGDRRDRRGRSLMDEARDYFADDEAPVRELALAHLGGDG